MRNRQWFACRTGFVEIMVPCFGVWALDRLLHSLDLSPTSWGWGHGLQNLPRAVGLKAMTLTNTSLSPAWARTFAATNGLPVLAIFGAGCAVQLARDQGLNHSPAPAQPRILAF
jgi:hypothetical protein